MNLQHRSPHTVQLLIIMLLCMALLLTVTVKAFAIDLTPEEKTEILKQAYRINGDRMNGLLDLTLVPPPEPELPPVKTAVMLPKPKPKPAPRDVCQRHKMHKVVTGKSWRCRK